MGSALMKTNKEYKKWIEEISYARTFLTVIPFGAIPRDRLTQLFDYTLFFLFCQYQIRDI